MQPGRASLFSKPVNVTVIKDDRRNVSIVCVSKADEDQLATASVQVDGGTTYTLPHSSFPAARVYSAYSVVVVYLDISMIEVADGETTVAVTCIANNTFGSIASQTSYVTILCKGSATVIKHASIIICCSANCFHSIISTGYALG